MKRNPPDPNEELEMLGLSEVELLLQAQEVVNSKEEVDLMDSSENIVTDVSLREN